MREQAYSFAEKAHAGVIRRDGSPYVSHPKRVAEILSSWNVDEEIVAAGLLHDVVEDTKYEDKDIRSAFGDRVADLVYGVTKISEIAASGSDNGREETYRRIINSSSKDHGVILIKLADRLDNMRTLSYLKPEKQLRIAQETMEIYAPLAHRLGMYLIYRELEDRAFAVLNPEAYERTTELLSASGAELNDRLKVAGDALMELLATYKIPARIIGRIKGVYSSYLKMEMLGQKDNAPLDLLGLRVITTRIQDCYLALGLIHTHWPPLPGGFIDHIAAPKANGYRSLHTKIRINDYPLEIQIRTEEMHEDAQFGLAAHATYKEAEKDRHQRYRKEFFDNINTEHDAFTTHLRGQLYSEEISVITPAGKVVLLPKGATAIDFAYHVHTDLGDHMVGAVIDGVPSPIGTVLQNNQTIHILTDENAHPEAYWTSLARTEKAFENIWRYLRAQNRLSNISRGRELLVEHMEQKSIKHLLSSWRLPYAAHKMGYTTAGKLYEALGLGDTKPWIVAKHILAAETSTPVDVKRHLLTIYGADADGVLAGVGQEVSEWGGGVRQHSGETVNNYFVLTMEIVGPGNINDLLPRLRGLPSVFDVGVETGNSSTPD